MAACLPESQWGKWSRVEKVGFSLSAIRLMESNNNYTAKNKTSSASGAYQFITSTWQTEAALAGVKGYKYAYQAPPDVQDKVAANAFTNILTRYGDSIKAIPLTWFGGAKIADRYFGGDVKVLSESTPGSQAGWASTWGGYASKFAQTVLCKGLLPTDVGIGFNYEWKNLPICLTEPRTGGEDVVQLKQLLGVTSGPDVYGTSLQYKVMRIQQDNNFPITGCFGKKEADLIVTFFDTDPDNDDGDIADGAVVLPTFSSNVLYSKGNVKLLEAAKKFSRSIYVLGGGHGYSSGKTLVERSLAGGPLDCSSLVGAALYLAYGVTDLRTSVGYLNSPNFKRIQFSEVQPGDILIRTKSIRGSTHIAIVESSGYVYHTNRTGTYPHSDKRSFTKDYQVAMRYIGKGL